MARQASSKSDSSSSSAAIIGFEADFCSLHLRESGFVSAPSRVQHFIHHLAPQTAMRDSALHQREASPQVVSEAKDNMADLVDTALRVSAFPQSEATPQVLSAAKNNMVALRGQLFYSTQIPVCLWFLAKNKAAVGKRPQFFQALVQRSRKGSGFLNRLTFDLTEDCKLAA